MKNPLISVIVPIYNTEKYLDKCIMSIIDQSYNNLEILLIDDGSTDKSLNICKKYQEKDFRIKVFTQENHGQAAARKAGVLKAKGQLIGFVDSDDWIEEKFFQHMVMLYMEYNCDLVSTGRILEGEDGESLKEETDCYDEGIYRNLEEIMTTLVYDARIKGHGLTSSLWNKLFKREMLQKIVLKRDERIFWGEDLCIVLDYCVHAGSICISHNKQYHYLLRDDSVSHRKDERLLTNFFRLYVELEKIAYHSENYFCLMRQIKQYVLLLDAAYMHGMFDLDLLSLCDWQFNYPPKVLESMIVIYGAGSCGQALYRMLSRQGKAGNVVAWIDKKGKGKERECLHEVIEPEMLKKLVFDYVIVAVQSKEVAGKIEEELNQKYLIDREKIIWREAEYEEA